MKEERKKHTARSAERHKLSAHLSFPITGLAQELWIDLRRVIQVSRYILYYARPLIAQYRSIMLFSQNRLLDF